MNVDLSKAKPFYALAQNGALLRNMFGTTNIYTYKGDAKQDVQVGQKVVKVYLVVEDDA